MKKRILFSWVFLWMLLVSAWAQGLLVTGVVKDKETRQMLANVNVSVQGSNVGTVTNADGMFSLKVSQEELGRGVHVSHIGYQNVFLPANPTELFGPRPSVLCLLSRNHPEAEALHRHLRSRDRCLQDRLQGARHYERPRADSAWLTPSEPKE